MTTYSFETHILRGRTEREWPVEVSYRFVDGEVELTRWAVDAATYPVTPAELDQLEQEAQDHAAEVLAEDPTLSGDGK